MAKYNYYAIGQGVDPDTGEKITNKICHSWNECQNYIKGVPNARYKGFLTSSEAKEWLKQFSNDDVHNTVIDKHMNNPIKSNNSNVIDKRFNAICKSINVDKDKVLDMLKEQFIQTYNIMMDVDD